MRHLGNALEFVQILTKTVNSGRNYDTIQTLEKRISNID